MLLIMILSIKDLHLWIRCWIHCCSCRCCIVHFHIGRCCIGRCCIGHCCRDCIDHCCIDHCIVHCYNWGQCYNSSFHSGWSPHQTDCWRTSKYRHQIIREWIQNFLSNATFREKTGCKSCKSQTLWIKKFMLTKLSFFLEKILNFFPPLKKSHSSLLKHYHNDDLHLSIIFFVSFKLLKKLSSRPSSPFIPSILSVFGLPSLPVDMSNHEDPHSSFDHSYDNKVFIIHMTAMIVMIIQLILFKILQLWFSYNLPVLQVQEPPVGRKNLVSPSSACGEKKFILSLLCKKKT